MLDIERIRSDFPMLRQEVYGKPLVYFDNAATTQKPVAVIDAMSDFLLQSNSNVHRGLHFFSEKATMEYEKARSTVAGFIHAPDPSQIVFTRGTTESINLLAFAFGEKHIGQGDEILITWLEHHSNIVPWQLLCQRKGAVLKVVPINDLGELLIDEFERLISPRTRIVSVTWVSNTLGTVNPVHEIVRIAHQKGIPVLIDAAQSIHHLPADVVALDCDFLAFSGHKAYGPDGIGVLYAKSPWFDELPPYQGGGDMIDKVTFEKTTYNVPPLKFEAGTPNISGAVGLAAALDYLSNIGLEHIAAYEHELLEYATRRLEDVGDVELYGKAKHKNAIVSFLIQGVHPSDTGMIIDKLGIAVRTGTHCTMPLMQRLGISGTVRASFAFYNTFAEIDKLIEAIQRVKKLMK